ncbi:MAG: hypothetical protein KatS3mg104_3032 [Phycisphaerae bacterium]|nr:MAG: hypothetical protein KatS3mg104_3032 [Phycisphaerae bacterium]
MENNNPITQFYFDYEGMATAPCILHGKSSVVVENSGRVVSLDQSECFVRSCVVVAESLSFVVASEDSTVLHDGMTNVLLRDRSCGRSYGNARCLASDKSVVTASDYSAVFLADSAGGYSRVYSHVVHNSLGLMVALEDSTVMLSCLPDDGQHPLRLCLHDRSTACIHPSKGCRTILPDELHVNDYDIYRFFIGRTDGHKSFGYRELDFNRFAKEGYKFEDRQYAVVVPSYVLGQEPDTDVAIKKVDAIAREIDLRTSILVEGLTKVIANNKLIQSVRE